MEDNKKILFLTPLLPYPAISGGLIKTDKMVNYLNTKYRIHLISLIKKADIKKESAYRATHENLCISTFRIDKQRTLMNYLLSLIHRMPLTVYRNRAKKLIIFIQKEINAYDIVIVDHYLMFQYIPLNYKGKIILHTHNAEYVMWERVASLTGNFIKRQILFREFIRIKEYEKAIAQRSDLILAAPNDINALIRLGIDRNKFIPTYHLGNESNSDIMAQRRHSPQKCMLMYVGTLSWEANIDGLIWFLEKVWPQIKEQLPKLTFSIIGKNPDSRILKIAKNIPDVFFEGFVEDLEPYYQRALAFIAPLRFGSGMKVKVISAMGQGLPVITTSIGVEGIEILNYVNVISEDTAEGFANAISKLHKNEELWNSIAERSYELVRNKYTWKSVYNGLEDAING